MQTAPPRAVRVKYVKDELGHWGDKLLPARELSPAQKTAVMSAMYKRCAVRAQLPKVAVSNWHAGVGTTVPLKAHVR